MKLSFIFFSGFFHNTTICHQFLFQQPKSNRGILKSQSNKYYLTNISLNRSNINFCSDSALPFFSSAQCRPCFFSCLFILSTQGKTKLILIVHSSCCNRSKASQTYHIFVLVTIELRNSYLGRLSTPLQLTYGLLVVYSLNYCLDRFGASQRILLLFSICKSECTEYDVFDATSNLVASLSG